MSSYCLSILNLLWIWQRKSLFAFSNSKREHISIFSLNQIKYDWLSRRPVSAVKGCSLPKTTLTPRCLHGCFSRSHALWFSVNHGQHEHAHQDWSSPILCFHTAHGNAELSASAPGILPFFFPLFTSFLSLLVLFLPQTVSTSAFVTCIPFLSFLHPLKLPSSQPPFNFISFKHIFKSRFYSWGKKTKTSKTTQRICLSLTCFLSIMIIFCKCHISFFCISKRCVYTPHFSLSLHPLMGI